ncbi:SecY-interacting protein Syd, partial [Escherichia coli]
SLPRSEDLYGIPSPCISASEDDAVFWQPQPFTLEHHLDGVERALEIVVQQPIHSYYTTQFAGDMHARFAEQNLTLLQAW